MIVKLKRYYGDARVTMSVMEVWMDGEESPRMVCEAREASYVDYEEVFPGASRCCLPVGRWRMKAGQSPYGAMGLRVLRCPGHRCVYIGHRWSRQWFEGEVLVGYVEPAGAPGDVQNECRGTEPAGAPGNVPRGEAAELRKRRITDGDVVLKELEGLVYEAFVNGEEFWLEVQRIGQPAVEEG